MFLIDEGSNRECCHDNKIFDILSSCFVSVPSSGAEAALKMISSESIIVIGGLEIL